MCDYSIFSIFILSINKYKGLILQSITIYPEVIYLLGACMKLRDPFGVVEVLEKTQA